MNFIKKRLKSQNIFTLIDDYTSENNQTLIKYIKKFPFSLYETNSYGISVYSYATMKNIDCLKDIHETYLNMQKKINENETYKNVLPYEIEHKITKYTPIHYSVEQNLILQTQYLIDIVDININHQTSTGNTPLHIACSLSNKKMVFILLSSKNIKLNILNKESHTPLFIASVNRNVRIVDMLLSKGASFKTIKHGKKKKFEFDVYLHIKEKQKEYPQIMILFEKYKKLRREQQKFKHYKKEYKYVCETLNDNVIDNSIKILANNLGIKSHKNLSKKELCNKIAQRIVIYAQNPNIIQDME